MGKTLAETVRDGVTNALAREAEGSVCVCVLGGGERDAWDDAWEGMCDEGRFGRG
jgi:hypothetical protein